MSLQVKPRRDGNPERMNVWTKETQRARRILLDETLGDHYLQLQVLATDPEFQRLGAGSQLCKWRMKLAELNNTAVAVFASPMGQRLYANLGFEGISRVNIEAKDKDESITLAALLFIPYG